MMSVHRAIRTPPWGPLRGCLAGTPFSLGASRSLRRRRRLRACAELALRVGQRVMEDRTIDKPQVRGRNRPGERERLAPLLRSAEVAEEAMRQRNPAV